MKLKSLVYSSSVLVMSLACVSNAALAQNVSAEEDASAAEQEAIVVTGSRIQRKDFVAPSPIVTVDTDAINNSGSATVDDYLKDLPQFTAGTGDFSNDSNGGTAGRATLNLRGLGAQRNLVLMDGQRLMSSGTDGAIDINTIPSLAIGGIEVISGGASATYGSDALSGVVNFKTRSNLNGFEVSGQVASTTEWDASTKRIGVAYGTDLSDGKGYLLLSAEHLDRGGVNTRDREFFFNPGLSSFITQGRSRIGANFLSVNDDGTIFNQGTGVGYTGPNDLPFLRGGPNNTGAVGYHGSYDNYLQVPLKRTAFFGKFDYDLGGVTAYAQGLYTTGEAQNIGAAAQCCGCAVGSYHPWHQPVFGCSARNQSRSIWCPRQSD